MPNSPTPDNITPDSTTPAHPAPGRVDDSPLPAHIEASVRSVADLHLRHHERTTLPQRALSSLTEAIGRPVALAVLAVVVAMWVGGNLLLAWLGMKPLDEPPFPWLESAATILALYTTVLILTVQRHDDRLARQREQLTLELAMLADQKSAKIIELLQKMRRDSPYLEEHDDAEATAMTRPADPQSVLSALGENGAGDNGGDKAVPARKEDGTPATG